MAKNKTFETENSVDEYFNAISDEKRRMDCRKICRICAEITGLPPKMWGPAIVGFGSYHYKYESGREGDAPLAGFSSRAEAITVYVESDFTQKETLLAQLGKHKTGKVCVYIKKLEDIDLSILSELIRCSVEYTRKQYPS